MAIRLDEKNVSRNDVGASCATSPTARFFPWNLAKSCTIVKRAPKAQRVLVVDWLSSFTQAVAAVKMESVGGS